MKEQIAILILGLLSVWNACFSQDIQYSQFYASPMYLNPAFAGTSDQHRVVGNFRDQWPSIQGAFVSYSLAYDVNIQDANSGLGFFVQRDQAGSGGLNTTNIGGVYAYDIKVKRKLSFRPAIGIAYGRKAINASKLRFGDQLLSGSGISIQSNTLNESVGYVDISAGGILYSNDFWAGYSVFHINRPNNSLLGRDNYLDAFHSIHVGYRLPMTRTVKREIVSAFIVAANYKSQGKWDQFDIGMYYFKRPFVVGLWYRGIPGLKAYKTGYQNNDAIVILSGMEFNKIKISYSYDITISKMWANTGGAHEVSVIYEYMNPHKKRRKRRVKLACPKF